MWVSKWKSKQFQSKNFKGVLSLLAGNSVARIITTVAGIFLANYYGTGNYGVYNVFLSYMMILPIFASLRLDNIMVLQKGSTEIRNLFSGIVLISLLLNMVFMLILGVLKAFHILPFEISYLFLLIIGIGSILTGWNLTQNFMFTKYKLFKQISYSIVITSFVSVVFQTLFYFLEQTQNGLIYGWLLGLLASFIYNVRVAKSRITKIDFSLFKESVKKHRKVIKYTFPSDAINAVANNIMPILVFLYFTESDVGVYAMANKILTLPLILLAGSVARVYFQKAVSLHGFDTKSLLRLTYKIIYSNLGLIFAFVLLMNTVGIYILELFFTENWTGLRSYILALSFWVVARSAWSPISDLVLVINKNQYSLVLNIYLLLVNFIGIYVGIKWDSFLYSVWTFSILSGLGYLFLLAVALKKLKKDVKVQ